MIELIAFVLIGLLLLALWQEIQKQQARKPSPNKRHPSKPSATATQHTGVKQETQNRLYAMCGGDHELVKRLTRGGGQAAWERAIHDLERDRR